MTKIKFCGLKTADDISFANELSPEYVGFVFAPKSKRYVTPAQAEKLRAALSEKICAVGVFVNENVQAVAELLNAGIIDAAQLHGSEGQRDRLPHLLPQTAGEYGNHLYLRCAELGYARRT